VRAVLQQLGRAALEEGAHLDREARHFFRLIGRASVRATQAVAGRWREILLVASYAGGWALITWGVARLLVPEVWMISGGVFLLSLGGLGLLKDVALEGFYVLSVSRDRRRR
jgi:hypothetical protein